MSIQLAMPPLPSGSEAQQLSAVRDYLFRMARQLNAALSELSPETFTVPAANGGAGTVTQNDGFTAHEADVLRSRIVATADLVQREIDTVERELRSNYVAQSEYGSFTQSVTASLAANAESFTAAYDYYSALAASVEAAGAGFEDYRRRTGGFIRAGIVDWKNGAPVFGMAVGQGLTATAVTVDGTEYEQIDPASFLSVFTANRLSFCQNGAEVAYLGGERLHITAAHITDRLEIGSGWQISPLRGLTVKWVG